MRPPQNGMLVIYAFCFRIIKDYRSGSTIYILFERITPPPRPTLRMCDNGEPVTNMSLNKSNNTIVIYLLLLPYINDYWRSRRYYDKALLRTILLRVTHIHTCARCPEDIAGAWRKTQKPECIGKVFLAVQLQGYFTGNWSLGAEEDSCHNNGDHNGHGTSP